MYFRSRTVGEDKESVFFSLAFFASGTNGSGDRMCRRKVKATENEEEEEQ